MAGGGIARRPVNLGAGMVEIVPMSERPNRARALAIINRRHRRSGSAQAQNTAQERDPLFDLTKWPDEKWPDEDDREALAALDELDRIYGACAADE
ncbi:MAG: hypothetical protein V4527_14945 [Pseudomonadota bacterium]